MDDCDTAGPEAYFIPANTKEALEFSASLLNFFMQQVAPQMPDKTVFAVFVPMALPTHMDDGYVEGLAPIIKGIGAAYGLPEVAFRWTAVRSMANPLDQSIFRLPEVLLYRVAPVEAGPAELVTA